MWHVLFFRLLANRVPFQFHLNTASRRMGLRSDVFGRALRPAMREAKGRTFPILFSPGRGGKDWKSLWRDRMSISLSAYQSKSKRFRHCGRLCDGRPIPSLGRCSQEGCEGKTDGMSGQPKQLRGFGGISFWGNLFSGSMLICGGTNSACWLGGTHGCGEPSH